MSRGKLTLNYLEHPIGMALLCLKGDLEKATNQKELRLIRAHWALAAKVFRKKSRKAGSRPVKGLAGKITGGITMEEMYLTYLKTAKKSLEYYWAGL